MGANARMVLQAADKIVFKELLENCAPCHNPNIELTIDQTLDNAASQPPLPGVRKRWRPRTNAAVCQWHIDV
jgi:hypothetical protein